MKKLQHILKFAVTFVLVAVFAISTNAANISSLSQSGVWAGGTLTKSLDITLTGDVDLKGPIIIPSGKKLIIRKKTGQFSTDSNGKPLYYARLYMSPDFTVPAGDIPCMFKVEEGGTLEIYGNDVEDDGDFIAIKGSTGGEPATPMTDGVFNASAVNAFYNDGIYKNVGRYYPDPTKTSFFYDFGKKNGAIDSGAILYVVGTLVIKHAKIASGFSTVEGAAIKRPTVSLSQYNNAIFGTMTLDHVHIRNCYSDSGSAIIIFNQAQDNLGGGNTPTGCSTTISNCKIFHNYSRCTEGVGGTIRTGGGVVGNLTMTNTTVYENYAGTYGGGMVTAAQGHEETVFVMDGCRIHGNRAATYAGAALISGSFQFKNNVTKIYNNKAGTYGGGLYLVTYNGVKFTTPKTLNMNFSDKLELYGNTAGTSAGAICLNMRELTSLVEGSEININFEGVNIHDNTAAQDGGAVMMTYDNSKVDVNLNIKSCTINNNNATAGNGGGIYCQVGPISGDDPSPNVDVTKCKVNLNGGTISNNHADAACGGGVYVKNLPIYCDQNASGIKVHGNTSLNKGGGLYITGSEFTMYSGQIYSNSCTSASCEGGGIYADGAELNITGGVIGGNSAAYANKSHNGAGIFLYNSDLVMNQGQVSYNESNNNAGGIYVKGTSDFTFNNGSISNNTTETYGGGLYVAGCQSFRITDGVISGNTAKNNNGGAMFFASGANNIIISGGEISNNKSAVRGGAIASATGFTISAGRIIGNTSNQGGGIYLSATTNSVVLSGGEVSGNESTDVGGGIYVLNGNLTIDGAEIKNNTSGSNGGGINYDVAGGLLSISGGEISNNKTTGTGAETGCGGGIYVSKGNLTIQGEQPLIKGNLATYRGGGIYYNVSGGTMSVTGGKIVDNVADVHGGGLYLEDGTLNITNAVISANKAPKTADINESGKGGGLYVLKSTARVNITGGMISSNAAERHGGGIYSSQGIVKIDGGQIVENTSPIGGGIYNYSATINMTGGNINNNVGRMGGGVCMGTPTASMTFSNGLITGNRASWTSSNLTTGYQQTGGQGFGGGVCVVAGTFAFDGASGVGLYNNIADKAGDDVFASGMNTTVTLPDVGAMNLSGYMTKTPELYWVEDYMNGDTGYAQGTYMNKAQGYVPIRYREAIANQNLVYPVPVSEGGQTFTNKYMALSIGHEIIYATLVRSGLLKGENAIYRVSRLDDNGTADKSDDRWTVYSELLLFGPEDALTAEQAANKSVSKRIALYSGTWKVEETGWAWTYDTDEAIIHEITGSSSTADKSFVFNGTKLKETDEGYVPAERYGESVVRNDFGSGTSETDKGAPASENGFETITHSGVSW